MNTQETTEQTTTLPNGITLSYATHGPPSEAAIVAIHGWPDSWRSFEWVMQALPPTTSAIAVSLRGFGESDRPNEGYEPADFAADVIALMETLGVPSAVVVGHSMGSVVAQQMARDRPDLVRGLVLIGGFERLDPALVDEVTPVLAELTDPVDEDFAREFQAGAMAQPIAADRFDQIIAESSKAPARVWRAAFAGVAAFAARSDGRSQITAPTLLVWGDQDGLIPRSEQDHLLAAIAGARLHVYEGAGHSPNWEVPERVAADIAAFAAEV